MKIKNKWVKSLFLSIQVGVLTLCCTLSCRAFAGQHYEEIKKVAQRSGCDVQSATMAEVMLGFGKGLNRNGSEPGVLQKFVQIAGRFEIGVIRQAVSENLDYLTVLEVDRSIMVDVRFEDKSSIQITFIAPSDRRRQQLDRIARIEDIAKQLDGFFKEFGSFTVQQRSGMLIVFDMEDIEERANPVAPAAVLRECDECHRSFPVEKLKLCGKCKSARYCGVDCQKVSWKKNHKDLCRPQLEAKPSAAPTLDADNVSDLPNSAAQKCIRLLKEYLVASPAERGELARLIWNNFSEQRYSKDQFKHLLESAGYKIDSFVSRFAIDSIFGIGQSDWPEENRVNSFSAQLVCLMNLSSDSEL